MDAMDCRGWEVRLSYPTLVLRNEVESRDFTFQLANLKVRYEDSITLIDSSGAIFLISPPSSDFAVRLAGALGQAKDDALRAIDDALQAKDDALRAIDDALRAKDDIIRELKAIVSPRVKPKPILLKAAPSSVTEMQFFNCLRTGNIAVAPHFAKFFSDLVKFSKEPHHHHQRVVAEIDQINTIIDSTNGYFTDEKMYSALLILAFSRIISSMVHQAAVYYKKATSNGYTVVTAFPDGLAVLPKLAPAIVVAVKNNLQTAIVEVTANCLNLLSTQVCNLSDQDWMNQSVYPIISLSLATNTKTPFDFQYDIRGFVPAEASEELKVIQVPLLAGNWCENKNNFISVLQALNEFNVTRQFKQPSCSSIRNIYVHEIGEKFVVYKYFGPNSVRSPIYYPQFLPTAVIETFGEMSVLKYDYIVGDHFPTNIRQIVQIIGQLAQLHQSKLCHGDIRLANIIFDRERQTAQLIDFDYTGTAGEQKYPPGYVREIPDGFRHSEATAGSVLHLVHDVYALHALLSELVFPDSRDFERIWNQFLESIRPENLSSFSESGLRISEFSDYQFTLNTHQSVHKYLYT
jgi:hypothetical protein